MSRMAVAMEYIFGFKCVIQDLKIELKDKIKYTYIMCDMSITSILLGYIIFNSISYHRLSYLL